MGVSWVGLQGEGPASALALARMAEELGYESMWVPELATAEPFALLGAIGASTDSIGLGTGIAALQLRPPTLAATAAATLQSLFGRDVYLGFGVSSPAIVQGWHGQAWDRDLLKRVREHVTVLRQVLARERTSFEGELERSKGYRLELPASERSPLVTLAALNPGMLRLAGELADAVLLAFPLPGEVAGVVERVREGEERAGREPGACRVLAYIRVAEAGFEESLPQLRRELSGYLMAPAYANRFARLGFEEDVRLANERWRRGERREAVDGIGAELVASVNVVGTAEQVRAGIARHVEDGVDHAILIPIALGEEPLEGARRTLAGARGAPVQEALA